MCLVDGVEVGCRCQDLSHAQPKPHGEHHRIYGSCAPLSEEVTKELLNLCFVLALVGAIRVVKPNALLNLRGRMEGKAAAKARLALP